MTLEHRNAPSSVSYFLWLKRPGCFEGATQREIWRILINHLGQTAQYRTSEKLAQRSMHPWLIAVHCWTSIGVEVSGELGLLEQQSS